MVFPVQIRPTPDFDFINASSNANWAIRTIEQAEKFKVKSLSTQDLTDPAEKQIDVDNSLLQIAEDFDDFNVMELAYIARHDNINTENEQYAPIGLLPSVNQKYSPNKIIALQGAMSYINTFDYDINAYIPNFASGTNGEYVNLVNGDIVIDLLRINEERLEVDFLSFEDAFDDTIYT